ncbi:MAG: hypothetical protein H8D45_30650 [Bacteroidetes bacterium]|nr:hypothetical protein [Bacteroidota bacterium]
MNKKSKEKSDKIFVPLKKDEVKLTEANILKDKIITAIDKEKLTEREAFEVYYAMGRRKSIHKLYYLLEKRITTSLLNRWAVVYYWDIRRKYRDMIIGEQLGQLNDESIMKRKTQYFEALSNTVDKYIKKVEGKKQFTVPIQDISDLERMIKLVLTITGQPTEIHQVQVKLIEVMITQIVNIINEFVPDSVTQGKISAKLRESIAKLEGNSMTRGALF